MPECRQATSAMADILLHGATKNRVSPLRRATCHALTLGIYPGPLTSESGSFFSFLQSLHILYFRVSTLITIDP
jgi:hypothetical protein